MNFVEGIVMVRVLQPAGFTRLNLLHIGLNDDFDEVIFLCSPESMNELEYERIVLTAKELGSTAKFSRIELPVIGEGASVSNIVQNLKHLKDNLSEMETVISTTGGTLKFGACLNYIFPENKTVGMNWREQVFWYSDGSKKTMKKLPEETTWKIFGLHHEIQDNTSLLFYEGELVATPSNVFLDNNKLHIEWINPPSSKKNKPNYGRSARAKDISRQIGRLCRINSEHRYNFSVPMSKWSDFDRYPIGTNRPIQPNDFFSKIPNEFFSSIQLPQFPNGVAMTSDLCLHIIVNVNDITPTAEAILAHRPDHVVLWFLDNEMDNEKRLEYRGKIGFLTSFIHGTLTDNLRHYNELNSSEILKLKPLEKLKTKFHLVTITTLEDVLLFTEFPNTNRTIFETNSGFTGFQRAVIQHLEKCGIKPERWYTDLIRATTSIISLQDKTEINLERDVAKNLLLRKRIPTRGEIISTNANFMKELSIALEGIISSKYLDGDRIWRLKKGQYAVGDRLVDISSKPENSPYEFIISLDGKRFLKLGEAKTGNRKTDTSTLGLWLEELIAYMIHFYWNSNYTIIGLNSQPFTGNPTEIGTNDDIDVYALTNYGEVIGEVKAIRANDPKTFYQPLGQLFGELAVVGHRKGQVPFIGVASKTDHLDTFAWKNNVIICNWWELQYPDHILHRLRTGERSDGELKLAEKVKLAENLRIAKEEAAAEAKKKGEEEAAAKKKADREAKTIKESSDNVDYSEAEHVLFAGEISLEQIHEYPGSEFACTISGIAELKGEIISISRTRFKKFFYPQFINPNVVGYRITVSRKKPKSLSKSKGLVKESKAYLDELRDIPRF